MQRRIFSFKRVLQASLLFLISSVLVTLLSLSFSPDHSFGILTPKVSRQVTTIPRQIITNTPARKKQTKPTSIPQSSPQPDYASGIISQDTFNRTSEIHWGHTDNGQPWQEFPSSDNAFTIEHNAGYITGQGLHYALSQPSVQNMEVDIIGSMSSFQGASLGVIVGWVNNISWYEAIINGTTFSLLKRASGVSTTLASIPFAAHVGTTYDIQCLLFQQQLSARVWFAGDAQPAQWQINATIHPSQLGFGGIIAMTQTGSIAVVNKFSEFVLYALKRNETIKIG